MNKILTVMAVAFAMACGNNNPVVADAAVDVAVDRGTPRDTGGPDYCGAGTNLRYPAPVRGCTTAQIACLDAAQTEAAVTACNAAACNTCLFASVTGCVGNAATAPCRSQFSCLFGCITTECPQGSPNTCVTGAITGSGPCAAALAAFDTCSNAQTACEDGRAAACLGGGDAAVDGAVSDAAVSDAVVTTDAVAADTAVVDTATNG